MLCLGALVQLITDFWTERLNITFEHNVCFRNLIEACVASPIFALSGWIRIDGHRPLALFRRDLPLNSVRVLLRVERLVRHFRQR